jgi:hypothetical protein
MIERPQAFAKKALIHEDVEVATLNRLGRMIAQRDAAIRKECADRAIQWCEEWAVFQPIDMPTELRAAIERNPPD